MERITFGKDLPGFAVGEEKRPGVVVVQQYFGVTDEIRKQAELISRMGYRCLVPDLYRGKIGVDMEEAEHLMNSLDFVAATDSITKAVNFLREAGSKRVGVVGFWWAT